MQVHCLLAQYRFGRMQDESKNESNIHDKKQEKDLNIHSQDAGYI